MTTAKDGLSFSAPDEPLSDPATGPIKSLADNPSAHSGC